MKLYTRRLFSLKRSERKFSHRFVETKFGKQSVVETGIKSLKFFPPPLLCKTGITSVFIDRTSLTQILLTFSSIDSSLFRGKRVGGDLCELLTADNIFRKILVVFFFFLKQKRIN